MRSIRNLKDPRSKIDLLKAVIIVCSLFVFVFGAAILSGNATPGQPADEQLEMYPADTTFASLDEIDPAALETFNEDPAEAQIDYSRFLHTNPSHSRLPCLLCHRREDNSTRLRFPGKSGHAPCVGCHVEQMSNTGSAMCTICHSNPQSGAMKAFPRLRSFRVKFDHGRHLRLTNCATCHKPTRRGVALSIPAGASAHQSCFQCHTNTRPIGTCNTCHTLGRPVRNSDWANAYNKNFSHREHTARMSCNTCHTVRAGAARGRQVSSPTASMHFASARTRSCASCHNDKRAFGTENFANCKRCHEGATFRMR